MLISMTSPLLRARARAPHSRPAILPRHPCGFGEHAARAVLRAWPPTQRACDRCRHVATTIIARSAWRGAPGRPGTQLGAQARAAAAARGPRLRRQRLQRARRAARGVRQLARRARGRRRHVVARVAGRAAGGAAAHVVDDVAVEQRALLYALHDLRAAPPRPECQHAGALQPMRGHSAVDRCTAALPALPPDKLMQ